MRLRIGVAVSQEVIAPRSVRRDGGVRVTDPLWSVAYERRHAADDQAAVVTFDMAAFNDLVSIDELTAYIDTDLVARRGVERVRRVLPELDVPVFDRSGRFVGTPDVIDPAAGVYGMYDGALHLAGTVRHADVAKEAAYRRLGLEGVTMMSGDVADSDPFRLRLRDAYARADRRPAAHREWMLETPRWWRDTTTVAARRALSSCDRRRLLAHRQRAA